VSCRRRSRHGTSCSCARSLVFPPAAPPAVQAGKTTKVVALVDALGNLVHFVLLPGQRHDSVGVKPLITAIDFAALLADKAFDTNAIRAELGERGTLAVIPSKTNRKPIIPHDAEMYKWRHLIPSSEILTSPEIAAGLPRRPMNAAIPATLFPELLYYNIPRNGPCLDGRLDTIQHKKGVLCGRSR
jgi:hypothetical protein